MEIKWTDLALETLEETLSFVNKKWSRRVVRKVRDGIYQEVVLLKDFPQKGKSIIVSGLEAFDLRVLVINKRSKVFYLVFQERIYIVLVWDVRRNPEILKNRLALFLKRY